MKVAQNGGRDFEKIALSPLAGSLGAEVDGVDLSRPLDQQSFDEVHRALLAHQVLFFRDQALEPKHLAEFAGRFGPLNRHPYVKPMDEHPDIFAIVKEPDDKHHFGNGWHTDLSYTEKPALGTMLYGKDVPECGGDTAFANMYLAYEALSDGMKKMLSKVRAVFSNARTYGPDAERFKTGVSKMSVTQAEIGTVSHPLVRTHPETGRKCLFVNELHCVGLENMSDEEAAPILRFLYDHSTRPEFQCRFRWRPGSLAFWDNRCTMHYAIDDFAGHRREMHRVTIEGDRPF